MKNNTFKLGVIGLMLTLFVSCGVTKKTPIVIAPEYVDINLTLLNEPQSNRYINLDYGIKLYVDDNRSDESILKRYDTNVGAVEPIVTTSPDVESFVSESSRRYMRTLGFNLDSDVATDYIMTLNISEFNVSCLSGIGWSAVVKLSVELKDKNSQLVYPSTVAVGRYTVQNNYGYSYDKNTLATKAINGAYERALADIDWDRIAFFLKRATPKLEANKQVNGDGNTGLESTVIRWYVTSAPMGADVYWRVVSSTPEVKNTNQNYLGTTPYESTESFDIIGLTYNNSGNVQIEISCERAGYMPQRKRFNVRQAIDQKEISTKMNLVKEIIAE